MNRSGPNVGQSSRQPRERASASGMTGVWSASPAGQAGRLPYLAVHGKPHDSDAVHWDLEPASEFQKRTPQNGYVMRLNDKRIFDRCSAELFSGKDEGAPPLSMGARTRNSCGSWKVRRL